MRFVWSVCLVAALIASAYDATASLTSRGGPVRASAFLRRKPWRHPAPPAPRTHRAEFRAESDLGVFAEQHWRRLNALLDDEAGHALGGRPDEPGAARDAAEPVAAAAARILAAARRDLGYRRLLGKLRADPIAMLLFVHVSRQAELRYTYDDRPPQTAQQRLFDDLMTLMQADREAREGRPRLFAGDAALAHFKERYFRLTVYSAPNELELLPKARVRQAAAGMFSVKQVNETFDDLL